MFDKLFNWGKKETPRQPEISFGRYSDNNKTPEKIQRWTDADRLFKEKNYTAGLDAFFDYITDDAAKNVQYERNGSNFSFAIWQGSKVVRGTGNAQQLSAEVSLARMPQASVPVMRRLLEHNFVLYYSRYALDRDRLCMRFDSAIETASPNKLYYGLKELATKADKQDDLLVNDFNALTSFDMDHLADMDPLEKQLKYRFFGEWIDSTLNLIGTLDADKISGGISYLLLNLIYRIDFLIRPEGALLHELEKISGIYWAKDEKPATEKNTNMIAAFKKLRAIAEADFNNSLHNSRSTFSIVAPQQQSTIAESITNANNNMLWYRDNGYPEIARQISEYGIAFSQYSYSLPRPLTDLFLLLLQVNYPAYFTALGFQPSLFDMAANRFDEDLITERIRAVIAQWQKKYPKLAFSIQQLKFDNLVNFNHSFTTELAKLNFDN